MRAAAGSDHGLLEKRGAYRRPEYTGRSVDWVARAGTRPAPTGQWGEICWLDTLAGKERARSLARGGVAGLGTTGELRGNRGGTAGELRGKGG